MKTIVKENISKEIVKKVVNKITTTDENIVIRLPKRVFNVQIQEGTTYAHKRFLNIDFQDEWVNWITLVRKIRKDINNYLGEDFVKNTQNCGYDGCDGHIGIHYNDDPCCKIIVKEDNEDYIILTQTIATKLETEYIHFDK